MKIAVATIDGATLSQHFGQSKGFVVFEVEGTTVRSRELRTNDLTPHEQGLCNRDEEHQHGTHSHGSLFEMLSGCGAVLCGGMGAGAAQALEANGIKAVILSGPSSADDAIANYINGNIPAAQSGFCNCQH